jgi:hypothetical protein
VFRGLVGADRVDQNTDDSNTHGSAEQTESKSCHIDWPGRM